MKLQQESHDTKEAAFCFDRSKPELKKHLDLSLKLAKLAFAIRHPGNSLLVNVSEAISNDNEAVARRNLQPIRSVAGPSREQISDIINSQVISFYSLTY